MGPFVLLVFLRVAEGPREMLLCEAEWYAETVGDGQFVAETLLPPPLPLQQVC